MPSQKHPVQITRDEHDNDLYAKRISMVSAATIYVVGSPVISLATADIEIGAVEIKDASSDTRATVGADGLYVDVQNTINSIATIANFSSIGLATVDVRNTVDVSSTDLDIRDLDSSQDSVSAVQSGTWDIGTISTLPEVNSLTTILNASAIGLATVNVQNTVTVDATGQGDVPITLDGEEVVLAAGTSFIGLASVQGNVNATQAGTWNIGTLTGITNDVSIDDGGNTITVDGTVAATQSGTWDVGTVTTLPVVNSLTTILNPTAIGLATVNINGTVAATQSGTWDIGTLTGITNDVNIADGGNTITVDGTVTANLGATDNTLLDGIAGLVPAGYDYISLSYTGDNLTGVVFKTGGSGGSTVATLTLAYTGSQLDSVTKS